MPKSIAYCADGTWNHPGETQDGLPADTNVCKIHRALTLSATQLPMYDDGVGSDGTPIERLTGGAFGDGLLAKIKKGYTAIAHAYQDGDAIFLFGFSRGAYTARSMGGMIAACGLPTQDRLNDSAVNDAFAAYRDLKNRAALKAALTQKYGNRDVGIAMIGVWDTVGALGIPGLWFQNLDHAIYGFLDTSLHPSVKSAFHAISIDERRSQFVPTLWDPLTAAAVQSGNSLKQVWFAGVHSDVGGGYAQTGLSDIALWWMMKQAIDQGLQFDPLALRTYDAIDREHSLDVQHESWSPLWGFPQRRNVPLSAVVANSVQIRCQEMLTYRPPNLSANLDGYTIEPIV